MQAGEELAERDTTGKNHYKQIFMSWRMYILSIFLLCYVGTAVSIASGLIPAIFLSQLKSVLIPAVGWSVTYILQVRGGGDNSGYVAAGFFGGRSTCFPYLL